MSKAAPAPPQDEADALWQQAVGLQQQGKLDQAQACCERILQIRPGHLDALNCLAMIAYFARRLDKAIEWIDRAIAVDPDNAGLYSNRGMLLQELGQVDAAIASYARAVELQPGLAQAHGNRGIALLGQRRYAQALESLDAAVAASPEYADAHYNRALAIKELHRLDEALAAGERAIYLRPDHAESHFARGVVLQELGRNADAVASYDRALQIRPGMAEALCNRGMARQALGHKELALADFDHAIELQPDDAEAHFNRGIVLEASRKFEAAIASYDRAVAIRPDHVRALCNRGVALQGLGRVEEAIPSYDRALALQSDLVEAHANRGIALQALGRFDEALAGYDRAVAIAPDGALGHWNRALLRLLRGEFEAGWAEYEWRWKTGGLNFPDRGFAQPLWLGREPLAGRTILLHAEQGLGDTIQFCRYVPLVRERGARVILEVQPPLLRLLAHLDGAAQIIARGSALPPFDCHCPLLSLPLAFQTRIETIPASPTSLRIDAGALAAWSRLLGPAARPRVGIVWSGSTEHSNDRNRSLALSRLLEYLPGEFGYVSLQKELREADRAVLDAHPAIRHFGAQLSDFTDTAALCGLMDVVVSVDTSVAHLSAALGRPTWVLLPFSPDWRWLLARDDSPWYPAMRLYRQERLGNWDGALRRVGAELRRLASGSR